MLGLWFGVREKNYRQITIDWLSGRSWAALGRLGASGSRSLALAALERQRPEQKEEVECTSSA